MEKKRQLPLDEDGNPVPSKVKLWLSQLIILLLLMSALVWLIQKRNSAPAPVQAWRPLTHEQILAPFSGELRYPHIAPNGGVVAFSLQKDSPDPRANMHLRTTSAGTLVQVTSNPGHEYRSAWAPDSSELMFARQELSGTTGIYRIPVVGGKEQKILECHSRIWSLDWSPDAKDLILSEQQAPTKPWEIVRVSLQDSFRLSITKPPGFARGDGQAVFSQDGKWIAFAREDGVGRQSLMVVPSVGGEAERLVPNLAEIRGITWHASGRQLLFATLIEGRSALWRFDMQARVKHPVPLETDDVAYPSLSADGNIMVFAAGVPETAIYELKRGARPSRRPMPFLDSKGLDHHPEISPDGSEIAFVSNRSGKTQLWVCDRQGEQARQITQMENWEIAAPKWSSDGKWLAFTAYLGEETAVYTVPSVGGEARLVIAQKTGLICRGWARDDAALFLASSASGSWELRRWALHGSGDESVTLSAGFLVEQNPVGDGHFYSFLHKLGVWERDRHGESRLLFADEDQLRHVPWRVTNQGIYYLREIRGKTSLCFYQFSNKRIQVVAELSMREWSSFDVTPDGRSFLITATSQRQSQLGLAKSH